MSRNIKSQEAKTARQLAISLLLTLAGTVTIQYIVLAVLVAIGKSDALPAFEHLFNGLLPVLSGLTGSAVTFYLTRRSNVEPQKVRK